MEDRVDAFMYMINFKGDPSKIIPETRAAFLRMMTYLDPSVTPAVPLPEKIANSGRKVILYDKLLQITPEKVASLVSSGGPNTGGSFGTIKINPAEPDRLWKVIVPMHHFTIQDTAFMIIKECFIQHILTYDGPMGHTVPKLYGIFRGRTSNDKPAIFVEMERGGKSLATVQDDTTFEAPKPGGGIVYLSSFMPFAKYLAEILEILRYFHHTYGFTHRDLKLTNMILSADGSRAQLVDFGMSCITINVGGVTYTITPNIGYNYGLRCIQQQDMAMLLMDLVNNYDIDDHYLQEFLDDAIPHSLQPKIMGTLMHTRIAAKAAPSAYSASYNRDGTFYPSLPKAEFDSLTIDVVLAKLRSVMSRYISNSNYGGGGRRRGATRRKRSQRTRKSKQRK